MGIHGGKLAARARIVRRTHLFSNHHEYAAVVESVEKTDERFRALMGIRLDEDRVVWQ